MCLPEGHFLLYIMIKNNTKKQQSDSTYQSTPIKVAVLVDGGYFIKRYNVLYNTKKNKTPIDIVQDLYYIAHSHVGNNNYLYRIFFYDCEPFAKKVHNPISKKCIDFSKTPEAERQRQIFEELKRKRKVALRLGTLKDCRSWNIYPSILKKLLSKEITIDKITEKDVYYSLRQKGIDMKIAVDITSLALKRFVDKIVLIAGDSDFVPAAKLARREGIDFVLDPMHSNHIESSLYEHIDGLKSIPLPKKKEITTYLAQVY
jgi:uncharacterized LabA/DUF88 family protein